MQTSPVVTERCCRAPTSFSSSSFPGQESTFCNMSQLWTLVSQGSMCHILALFGWCCCLALVLLLLFRVRFKVDPGEFLKCLFRREYIGISKSQNGEISFLLLYSLWHLFSFPHRIPGGRSTTLPPALEIVVHVFIKIEGDGGNSRRFL